MEIVLILLFLFFAMIIGAMIGFGDALILIPLLALVIGIQEAIVLTAFWGFLLGIFNWIKYRQYLDIPFVKKSLYTGIPAVILGSFLIVVIPTRWIEFSLGIFIFIYVWYKFRLDLKVFREKKTIENKPLDHEDTIIYIGSFAYGFLGGLIGASGPINVILLERTGHEKESMICNFAVNGTILTVFKLGVYLWSGLFPIDYLWIYFVGFGVILVSSLIGYKLSSKIPKAQFTLIVLILLLIISIRFMVVSLFFE